MSESHQLATQARSSAAIAAQSRELGEIQAGAMIAMQYPRREAECFSKAVEACKRPKFAETCRYEFPRGGSMVSGPSINLARELARLWGNIRYGFNVVDADEFNYSIEGWAFDLQTNTRVSVQARFRRLIFRKARGNQPAGEYEPNEREALELVNRNGAKAVRNALLQLFPADLVEDALDTVAETLVNGAGVDRAKQKRQLVHAYRSKFGIGEADLERRIGLPLENWSADDILQLNGIFTALKEGHASRDEFFAKADAEPEKTATHKAAETTLDRLTKELTTPEKDAMTLLTQDLLVETLAAGTEQLAEETYRPAPIVRGACDKCGMENTYPADRKTFACSRCSEISVIKS